MRCIRYMLCLALALLCCASCEALPGEEHAFAVALGVDIDDAGQWLVCARIPSYQDEGSYQTISAQGDTPATALTHLDARSPMQLHLGQLRLLIFSEKVAQESEVAPLMRLLAERADMRQQALIAVTQDGLTALFDQLQPRTGTRLSKSLDVLMESRQTQGVIPRMTLGTAMRMDDRQALIAPMIFSRDEGFDVRGAAVFDAEMRCTGTLTEAETQLLALLSGQMKKGAISLASGTVDIQAFRGSPRVTSDSIVCDVCVNVARAELPADTIRDELAEAILNLAGKLQAAGCDALGLARQTVYSYPDVTAWHDAGWPSRALALPWRVKVTVQMPA